MSGQSGPGVGVETPVESAELHHVVHQVDDGLQPRHLLLQAPRVLPQLFSPLADNKQTKESSSWLPQKENNKQTKESSCWLPQKADNKQTKESFKNVAAAIFPLADNKQTKKALVGCRSSSPP